MLFCRNAAPMAIKKRANPAASQKPYSHQVLSLWAGVLAEAARCAALTAALPALPSVAVFGSYPYTATA